MDQERYSIIFSSVTGNTKLLADALRETLPKDACDYFGASENAPTDSKLLYVGFWTDKGNADNATLAGDVTLAEESSVWYGAVLRADTGRITVGAGSNVQDNAVLHTGPNLGVTIGKNVSIGHSAVVHGCTVGDGALIGMHATVMNGAVVGKNAVVAAGALVLENTVVPDGMVAMGVPAKVREAASPALVEANRKNAEGYVAEATAHAEANK